MKNKYALSEDGTTATIFLKRRSGEILHCHVDSADLPKLLAFKTTWFAQWKNDIQDFYVAGNVTVGDKQTTIKIHRFLMDAPKGLQVDHWNHDTLDNRRSNLRVVTQSVNQMNRKGATCKSTTGHRAIYPHRPSGKLRLQVYIDGKLTHIGMFSTIEDAIAVRNQFSGYN